MKNRSPVAVVLLTLITFGLYSIYWSVSTKNEMNNRGEKIPTAWLIIIPFVNFYWYWEYSKGVEHVTNAQMSGAETFLLLVLVGIVGMPITQSAFNKVDSSVPASATPSGPPPSETTMVPAQPAPEDSGTIAPTTPALQPPSAEETLSPDVSAPDSTAPSPPSEEGVIRPQGLVDGTSDPADAPKSTPPNPPLVQ